MSKLASYFLATRPKTLTAAVIPVWAESVTVSPDILTLEAGKSAKLSALVGPEKATDKSVRWKTNVT